MTRIVILGEAYGETEALINKPFVGSSGFELLRMLSDSGILTLTPDDREDLKRRWFESEPAKAAWATAKVWINHESEIYPTNVFNLRPEKNDIDALTTTATGDHLGLPPIRAGKYIRREFLPEIERVGKELADHAPNLIIALGATAAWYLLHSSGISKIRGTISQSFDGRYKVLPVYHPAAVLRDWSLRPVTVLDLAKAKREAEFPEVRRPKRTLYMEPTLEDLEWYWHNFLKDAKIISFDIETAGDQITCIGFAATIDRALIIPFVDYRKPEGSYWPSLQHEAQAWAFVRRVLQSRARKVGQNLMYDCTFLWKQYGIWTENVTDDTMLLHHILQPESEKGLGFLGSVYTNEPAWKLMRARGAGTIKREE